MRERLRNKNCIKGLDQVSQIIECAVAVNNLEFTDAELQEIDQYAEDQDINLWAKSSATD